MILILLQEERQIYLNRDSNIKPSLILSEGITAIMYNYKLQKCIFITRRTFEINIEYVKLSRNSAVCAIFVLRKIS